MFLPGLGLALISFSWIYWLDGGANSWLQTAVLLATGCFCLIYSMRKTSVDRISAGQRMPALFLLILSIFLPVPYRLGYLGMGLGILGMGTKKEIIRSIGIGLVICSLIVSVQTALFPLYLKIAARHDPLSLFTPAMVAILKGLGVDCYGEGHRIYIQAAKKVLEFTLTLHKVGLLEFLSLFSGGVLLIMIFAARNRLFWIMAIGFGLVLSLVIRTVVLILVYLDFGQPITLWNPLTSASTLLPMVLIIFRMIPRSQVSNMPFTFAAGRKIRFVYMVPYALLAMGGTAMVIVSLWANDPGHRKSGRVLIDEYHSDWEWTTRPFDTKWYGATSHYNYYCMAEYLGYHFRVERLFNPISPDLLKPGDILIVKTPTQPFTDEELKTIYSFVQNGGGLFLIGDHTNVFGSSTYLNQLSAKFGLVFNPDATYDLHTGELSLYRPPALLPHPVVQHFQQLLFGTSCSLSAGVTAEDVIIGSGLKAVRADYGRKHFFPEQINTSEMIWGPVLQSAAVQSGRGRVLAFTDSTIFSNFWMFMPGKPELLLGSVTWLERQNHFQIEARVLCILSGMVLLFGTFVWSFHRHGTHGLIICGISVLLAAPLAVFTAGALNKEAYQPKAAHTKFTRIGFDLEHCQIQLPVSEQIKDQTHSYQTFYVWTQRLGYVPAAYQRLTEALQNADPVVVINPVRPFSSATKRETVQFVEAGGTLLLLVGGESETSTANELARLFGLNVDFENTGPTVFSHASGKSITSTASAVTVTGGMPVFVDSKSRSILSLVRYGKGMFIVMTDAALFNDRWMGTTASVPNAQQLKRYDLEYWILTGLIDR